MSRPKPKFRMGQVVCKRNGSHPRFVVIIRGNKTKTLWDLSDGRSMLTSELRALTIREIGPRKRP